MNQQPSGHRNAAGDCWNYPCPPNLKFTCSVGNGRPVSIPSEYVTITTTFQSKTPVSSCGHGHCVVRAVGPLSPTCDKNSRPSAVIDAPSLSSPPEKVNSEIPTFAGSGDLKNEKKFKVKEEPIEAIGHDSRSRDFKLQNIATPLQSNVNILVTKTELTETQTQPKEVDRKISNCIPSSEPANIGNISNESPELATSNENENQYQILELMGQTIRVNLFPFNGCVKRKPSNKSQEMSERGRKYVKVNPEAPEMDSVPELNPTVEANHTLPTPKKKISPVTAPEVDIVQDQKPFIKTELETSAGNYLKSGQPDSDGSKNKNIHYVEKVLDLKYLNTSRKFLVKWFGHDSKLNSWELEDNFGRMVDNGPLAVFWQKRSKNAAERIICGWDEFMGTAATADYSTRSHLIL